MVQMSDDMTKQAEEFPVLEMDMERNSIVWNCNICTEKYEESSKLLKHMEDLHSEYTSECRVCLSRFINDALLGIHIKEVHVPKKPPLSSTAGKQGGKPGGKQTARKTTVEHSHPVNESTLNTIKKYFTRRFKQRTSSNSSEESYYKPKNLRQKSKINDYCWRCETQFDGTTEWRNHVVLNHILPRNPYPIVEMNYIDIEKLRVSPIPMICPDKGYSGELKIKFCREKDTYTIVEKTRRTNVDIDVDEISQSESENNEKLQLPALINNSNKKRVFECLGSSSDSIISSISSTNSHSGYVSSVDSNTTSTTSTSTGSESVSTTSTTTSKTSLSTSYLISASDDSISVSSSSSSNSRSSTNSIVSVNSTTSSASSTEEQTTDSKSKVKEIYPSKPKDKITEREAEIIKQRPRLKIALKRVSFGPPGHNAPSLPPCSTDYVCVIPTPTENENEKDLPIKEKEKDVSKSKEKAVLKAEKDISTKEKEAQVQVSKKETEKSNSKKTTMNTEIILNPDDSKIVSNTTDIPKISKLPKINDSKPVTVEKTNNSGSILASYLNNQYYREQKYQEEKMDPKNAETEPDLETNKLLEKVIDQIFEEDDDDDPEIIEIIIPDEIPEKYRKLSKSKIKLDGEKKGQLELLQDSRDNKMISEMPLIAKAIAFNNNNNNNNSAKSNNNHSSSKSVQEIVMEKDKMNNHENQCNITTTTTGENDPVGNTSENKSQLSHEAEVGINVVSNNNGEFERPRSQSNKSSSSSTTQDQDQNDETSQSNSSNCKENENEIENDFSKEMYENIDSNSTDLRIHIPEVEVEEGELDIDENKDQNQQDKALVQDGDNNGTNNEKEKIISSPANPLSVVEDLEGENNEVLPPQDDFECQVCQKVFNSDEELDIHFSTDHFRVGSSSHILESEESEQQDTTNNEQERIFLLQQQQLRQQQFQQRRQIIDGEGHHHHQKQPTVISRSPAATSNSTTTANTAGADKVNMIPLDLSLSTTAGSIVRAPVIESSQYQRISPPVSMTMTARPSITHGLSASAVMQRMSQPQQISHQQLQHHQYQQQQQHQQQRLHSSTSTPNMNMTMNINAQYPTSLHMALTNTNSPNIATGTGRYLQQQSHSEQPRVVEITTAIQKVPPVVQQQANYRITTPTGHIHQQQQQQQQYHVRNQTPALPSMQQLHLQHQQKQSVLHHQQLQQRTVAAAAVASSQQQQQPLANPNYRHQHHQHQLPNVHQQQQGLKRSLSLEEQQQYQHPKQPRIDHLHQQQQQQQHLESSNNYSALRICPTTTTVDHQHQQQQRAINNSQISPHQNNNLNPDGGNAQMNSVRIGNAITLSVCPSIDNQQQQQQQPQMDQHLSVNVHHNHGGNSSNSNSPHTPTSPFSASSAVASALAVRGVTVTPASPVYPGASHLNRLQNTIQNHGPAVLQALNHPRPVYSPPTLQPIPISHVNTSPNIPTHQFAMPKNPAPRIQQLQQQQQQQQHISPPLSVNSTTSRPERPPTIDLTEDEIAAHQIEQAHARYVHAQMQRQQQQHHASQQGQTRTMPLAQASPSNPISRSPNSGSISRPIICNICNQLYQSLQLLEEHKLRYHPPSNHQSNVNVSSSHNTPIGIPQSQPQPSPPITQTAISQAQIQARQQHLSAQQHQHQQQQLAIRQKSQSQQQLVPIANSRSNVNSISPPRSSPSSANPNSKFMYIPLIDLSKLDSSNLQKLDDLGITCIIPLEGGPLDSSRSPTMGIPIMPIRSSRTSSNLNLPWENFLPIGPLSNPNQMARSLQHHQNQQNHQQHLHQQQQQQQHQSHTSKPHSNYPSH